MQSLKTGLAQAFRLSERGGGQFAVSPTIAVPTSGYESVVEPVATALELELLGIAFPRDDVAFDVGVGAFR